jgi:hypothetical protein
MIAILLESKSAISLTQENRGDQAIAAVFVVLEVARLVWSDSGPGARTYLSPRIGLSRTINLIDAAQPGVSYDRAMGASRSWDHTGGNCIGSEPADGAGDRGGQRYRP